MGVVSVGVVKMCGRKHCAKLQKYIQLKELAKFRSYVRRHSVDVVELRDDEGNSLLHLSCKYGCEVILRYVGLCRIHSLFAPGPIRSPERIGQ